MQAAEIKQRIEAQLPNSKVTVEGADGSHFSATIISAEFIGKNKVQRQQLIYKILGDDISSGAIHALSLQTLAPNE